MLAVTYLSTIHDTLLKIFQQIHLRFRAFHKGPLNFHSPLCINKANSLFGIVIDRTISKISAFTSRNLQPQTMITIGGRRQWRALSSAKAPPKLPAWSVQVYQTRANPLPAWKLANNRVAFHQAHCPPINSPNVTIDNDDDDDAGKVFAPVIFLGSEKARHNPLASN